MEKREEVKEFLLSKCKILNTYSWSDDRKAYDVPKYVLSDSKTLKLIDQIYNYNEAQLKAKDEEIERLKEALQQPKSCEWCRFYHSYTGVCANDKCPLCADFVNADFGCIHYEAKDEQ